MIGNIILLLAANTLMPFFPIPPQVFILAPFTQIYFTETTAFDYFNISRLHSDEEFRVSFRQAIKANHPDRGGDKDIFDQIKNLKSIMQKDKRLYDTLNITIVDLQLSDSMDNIVSNKQLTYFSFSLIYYIITLFYCLFFTIDDDLKPSRKYLIPLILVFMTYQYYIYSFPSSTTIIDLINNKIPIFIQVHLLKNILSIWIAIIRTKYIRKETNQKKLLQQFYREGLSENVYIQLLKEIKLIYEIKCRQKFQDQNSKWTKIRNWISKGISIIILIIVFSSLFSQQEKSGNQFQI